jgi:hypothetical protein
MAGVAWNNGGDRSIVDIQPNGPGNAWQVFDTNGGLDAPSGGGRARTTMWGRGDRGGLQPRSIVYTGNPDDWTANLDYPLTSENALKRLTCPFSVRARQYCSPNKNTPTAYVSPGMRGYLLTTVTKYGYDNGLAMSDGQATDVKRTAAIDGSLEVAWVPVAHDDISLTTSDVAYKRVINIGAEVCAGACGIAATEEDAWLAVTLKDSSPSYAGGSAPWLYWTVDRWVTRTGVRIGNYIGADARDVVLAGSRVIVFSDTKAPVYAQLADIYNGVADPLLWANSTGFTGITSTNFPIAAVAVDSSTIMCVGGGGRIWLSTDGGLSFSLIYDTGTLTTQNLLAVDAQASGNVFAGGNSGVWIRLSKTPGAFSYTGTLIVVKDASNNILSSNIQSVRTPPTRGDEVTLGTSGGEIWRTKNANATRVVFKNMTFDKAGIGSIPDHVYAGFAGNTLFVLQSYTDGTTRVLRDFSGNNLANDVEIIGDYVTPGNFGIVSITAANENMAITAGNNHGTYAFLGMIRPAQ